MELPLWASNEVRGRWIGEPSPVTFYAPAAKCSPVEGEDYSDSVSSLSVLLDAACE